MEDEHDDFKRIEVVLIKCLGLTQAELLPYIYGGGSV